jgi:D-psicose/D-tagatose/L-ribulose 3-epimerase
VTMTPSAARSNRNSIGANTWIWASPLSDERLSTLVPHVKALGFDVIELPVENLGDWDPGRAAELLAENRLASSLCAAMPAGRDLLSSDEEVASTQDFLRRCIEIAHRIGAPVVGGPMYSAVGRTWLLEPDERRRTIERLVEALRPVIDHAGERGVKLALEPLNRYETSLINTAEQGLEVVEAVDSAAFGLLLDTYHMNIEEKSPADAIRLAGERVYHVHSSASDRGAPGADHFDWPAFASTLRDVAYTGTLCIEAFTPDDEAIARAAHIWRPVAATQDDLACDGLAFLRGLCAPASVAAPRAAMKDNRPT